MKRNRLPVPLLALALLLAAPWGVAHSAGEPPAEEPAAEAAAPEEPALDGEEVTAPLPADQLGLRKGSLLEVPVPGPVHPNTAFPGDGPSLPRAYPGAPPRVPHAVADLLPITRDANLCVDCHDLEEGGEGLPTPIPPSHRTDLRRSPQQVGEGVVGARWLCITCHVPTTDAEPLVENRFAVP